MRRYLVVANQTLGGERLIEEFRKLLKEGPCSFYVVVPNTPPEELAWVPEFPHTRAEASRAARQRLNQALDLLSSQGAEADGEIGDPNPVVAVEAILAEREFDEIIVSTLPHRMSRWLHMDFPSRLRRHVQVPVRVVTPKE